MALIYKPIDGPELDFARYAPGLQSNIAGKWGRHSIPGQKGQLLEDLGDGVLMSKLHLEFVGGTAEDYYTVIPAISRRRQGTLQHPRRGAVNVGIINIREEILWTERGINTTVVDIDLEASSTNQADSFRAGPSARAQSTVSQANAADAANATLQAKIFGRPDLTLRALMLTATANVRASTDAARSYAGAAQESFSLGLYGPSLQAQLQALPPMVSVAQVALRRVGPAADIQETQLGLESMLFSATQLDLAIRAAQPIPIQTKITRQPGQQLYAFVQQHYGRSGKQPAEMRALAGLILRLNPNINRPSLIPAGSIIVRPAA